MAIFTVSPWVLLALILALLLVILLAAFNRQAAENILRFFGGLLDLYQRWLQFLPHTARLSSVQSLKGIQQDNPSMVNQATSADTTHALSMLQLQTELPPQTKTSDTVGE